MNLNYYPNHISIQNIYHQQSCGKEITPLPVISTPSTVIVSEYTAS